MEYIENGLHGVKWDVMHITSDRSSFILLRGIIVIFLMYILIGMCIMTKVYDAQGHERVPHMSFWMTYPGLVADGVYYAKDLVGANACADGTYQRVANPNNKFSGSRDTFSQFEPI